MHFGTESRGGVCDRNSGAAVIRWLLTTWELPKPSRKLALNFIATAKTPNKETGFLTQYAWVKPDPPGAPLKKGGTRVIKTRLIGLQVHPEMF